MAYIDDLYLIGTPDTLLAAGRHIDTHGRAYGLHMNPTKSVTLDPHSNSRYIPPQYRTKTGITVLGCPIGLQEPENLHLESFLQSGVDDEEPPPFSDFTQSKVSEILDAQVQVADLLVNKLPGPIAFSLIHTCVANKPNFLARVVPPWVLAPAAKEFDLKIIASINLLLHTHMDPIPERILNLPTRLGGCGVPAITFTSPSAFSASFLAAVPYIPSWIWKKFSNSNSPCTSEYFNLLIRHLPVFREINEFGVRIQPDPSDESTYSPTFINMDPDHIARRARDNLLPFDIMTNSDPTACPPQFGVLDVVWCGESD